MPRGGVWLSTYFASLPRLLPLSSHSLIILHLLSQHEIRKRENPSAQDRSQQRHRSSRKDHTIPPPSPITPPATKRGNRGSGDTHARKLRELFCWTRGTSSCCFCGGKNGERIKENQERKRKERSFLRDNSKKTDKGIVRAGKPKKDAMKDGKKSRIDRQRGGTSQNFVSLTRRGWDIFIGAAAASQRSFEARRIWRGGRLGWEQAGRRE